MNILISETSILMIDPQDTGSQWEAPGQTIPKHVAEGAVVVDVTLPADYAPGRYTFVGGAFVAIPPPIIPVPVPVSISRAQGKAILIERGIWSSVLAYVAAIPDPTQKALAEVALNDTQEWRRESMFLSTVATVLGMTSVQLDTLFIDASGIVF